mgnify:CR=1 FL=1
MKAATQATAIAIVSYSDIEDDDATLGPLFTNLTSRTKTWIVSAAGFYRLMKQNRAFLDGMAGLRYWSVDSSLKFGAGILPARESSNREEWVDPIIGLKGLLPLGRVHVFSSAAPWFWGASVWDRISCGTVCSTWDINGPQPSLQPSDTLPGRRL